MLIVSKCFQLLFLGQLTGLLYLQFCHYSVFITRIFKKGFLLSYRIVVGYIFFPPKDYKPTRKEKMKNNKITMRSIGIKEKDWNFLTSS